MALLLYAAERLLEFDTPLRYEYRTEAILKNLISEYDIRNVGLRLVLILPDLELDTEAQADGDESITIFFVDARHSASDMLVDYTYEAMAVALSGVTIPNEGLALLARTSVPDIYSLSAEQQACQYVMAIKSGLIYRAPYEDQIDSIDTIPEYQRQWQQYIRYQLKK